MTVIGYLNASLEIWGCILSAVVTLCLVLSRPKMDSCKRLYFWILGCNSGALLFDAAALLFRGHTGLLPWWGVRMSNFIAFIMNYAFLESFMHYITEFISQRTAVSRVYLYISRIVCAVSCVLVVLTQFFPIFYTIDEQNIYHRAEFFYLSHVPAIIVILVCAAMLIRYRAYLEGQEKAALWSYVVLPLAAVTCQMFIYGLALTNLADVIATIVIFLFLQAEQGRHAAEQENLLMQSRVSIMLSQIQPHFLYNSLSVIQNMCHGKAPEAEQATIQFSEFLRGNLDSLQADQPIPFTQEMKHTQDYLWLEKQRFGEDLRVVYDIRADDFRIPALTLQPIVENAVRYGVMKKEYGGTVRISSREAEENFSVTVEDDGAGFDPYAPRDDGRTHIGISNVKERLRIMCGGTLELWSSPGKGTTAVITIPKKNVRKENENEDTGG